jgi:type III secretion protein J
MTRRHLLMPFLIFAAGCSTEPVLHGLDESQANEVLVALDEANVAGDKRREEGTAAAWVVAVRSRDVAAARRILADRELPRPRAPGFGEVFGEAGMVPTPVEEHARYLHALSGELSRSLESLDGVVEARVHLGLPQEDPLRPGAARPARAAILLRCRPASCDAVRRMEPGVRSLVAGAADGLAADAVSVLVAEAASAPVAPPTAAVGGRWRLPAAGALTLLGLGIALHAAGRRIRWRSLLKGSA